MGLRSGMAVSGGSLIRQVGLQWVFNEAGRSLMKHAGVSDGSPIRHMEVSAEACRGLRSSMSVSDGSPIGLRWVSIGLRWVSDNNNIFVNSKITKTFP